MTQREQQGCRPIGSQAIGPGEHSPDEWAEWFITQLHIVTEYGLPEVYGDNARGYLIDLWIGDMPYTEPLATQVREAIRTHPDFPVLRGVFLEMYDRDIWEPE